jgi:NAD(P)-dependent dehydrogenase (short-subunit alcohol dehydrogenase family)
MSAGGASTETSGLNGGRARLHPSDSASLAGRRVLITGPARGIGAALARRLSDRGARVALLGLEPERLAEVASRCGDAPWHECDVTDRGAVDAAVAELVERFGGLDVAVANAGIGAQMTLLEGDDSVWDATLAVNLAGTYNLVRAAGPYVAHPGGYFLLTASLAAAIHLPLMSAYCASKAAVESLGDSLRLELAPAGARVGVAYYAELDTDMTSRGFGTQAARRIKAIKLTRVAPLEVGIDALERGIARRSRRIVAPRWVALLLPTRMTVQRVVDRATQAGLAAALETARGEDAPLTTPQPEGDR